jgi:hypothetical protein
MQRRSMYWKMIRLASVFKCDKIKHLPSDGGMDAGCGPWKPQITKVSHSRESTDINAHITLGSQSREVTEINATEERRGRE